MQPIPDGDLLDDFARTGSDAAFGELVRRHVGLVYSVALRQTGQPHQAEEITQAVFIILARKAASVGRRAVLSGWLYHTARLTAANFRRAEFRRIRREQAVFMQSTLEQTAPDPAWSELAPLLDDAMSRLGATDRDAVVLRYFENKPLSEVGAALGLEERAAQKRIQRALEKLRKLFARRGVSLSAALLAGAMSAHSVHAAPVTLAHSTTAVALTKGALATASTLTLAQKTMNTMHWIKIKLALGVVTATLLAGAAATIALSDNSSPPPAQPLPALNQQKQIMIGSVFLKVPATQVDAVINAFTNTQILMNPDSPKFKALLAQHPEAEYLGAPRILTNPGGEAIFSRTKSVPMGGTNADVGIILDATPTIDPNSKITVKMRAELRELAARPPSAIRVTTDDETQTFKSPGTPIILRQDIQDDGGKTLLVFVNAMTVQQRLQKITQRNP